MTVANLETTLDQWLRSARHRLDITPLSPQIEMMGRVRQVADGVARISGLPDVGLNELVRFQGGQSGLILTLNKESLDAVIFDDGDRVEAGHKVTGTGTVVSVPVGEALLGRIVDPLGHPLDGGEAISAEQWYPVERAAPSIIERDLVTEPVETGVLVVDALFALGRGQRELIIGDRATGKTSIAVDAMINQKHSDIICATADRGVGRGIVALAR